MLLRGDGYFSLSLDAAYRVNFNPRREGTVYDRVVTPGRRLMKTRVALIEDHVSVRQMLAMILPREGIYEVVGEAGSGFEGLKMCRRLQPQLLILDLLLPE